MLFECPDYHNENLNELKKLRKEFPQKKSAIENKIKSLESGKRGENEAAHFLNRDLGSSTNSAVIHGLRIELSNNDAFQIDHLIIHRQTKTAYILESKNFSGKLFCDEYGDWKVIRRGQPPQDIKSPIEQARRQAAALKRWLQSKAIDDIRDFKHLVLVNPKTSLDRKHLPSTDHVIKSDNLLRWLESELDSPSPVATIALVTRHFLKPLSEDGLRELAEKIVAHHAPLKPNWRAQFGLPAEQVNRESDDTHASDLNDIDIWANRLADGRLAIRHKKNSVVSERLAEICAGKAEWKPYFKNWIVSDEFLEEICEALGTTCEVREK